MRLQLVAAKEPNVFVGSCGIRDVRQAGQPIVYGSTAKSLFQ